MSDLLRAWPIYVKVRRVFMLSKKSQPEISNFSKIFKKVKFWPFSGQIFAGFFTVGFEKRASFFQKFKNRFGNYFANFFDSCKTRLTNLIKCTHLDSRQQIYIFWSLLEELKKFNKSKSLRVSVNLFIYIVGVSLGWKFVRPSLTTQTQSHPCWLWQNITEGLLFLQAVT